MGRTHQFVCLCLFVFIFVRFDSLHPSQHFFSVMLGHVFLGLTSTKQRIKCLAQGHQRIASGELFVLILYVPFHNFSVMSGRVFLD